MLDCTCPANTSLTEIDALDCGIDLKQIQKLGFQRTQATAPFKLANPITALASWQAFLTASDDTKIVVTPLIGGEPIIEAGDKITTGGGDNSTLNGVEETEGVNPSTFSCIFKSLTPAIEKQMKALGCEKGLTVYLFLQGGNIACVNVATDERKGFEIQSFFLSDRNNAGYGTKDTFNCSFYLPAGWSEDLVKIMKADLDFNPLTDL